LGLTLTLVNQQKNKTSPVGGLLFFSLLVIAFSLGALRVEVAKWSFGESVLESKIEQVVTLRGLVVSLPEVREKNKVFELQTETDKILVLVDRYEMVTYGDEIEVTGRLTKPESFTTDLGRTFNYSGYLLAKGIEYRIVFAQIKILESGKGNQFQTQLFKFKEAFMKKLSEYIPEPASALGMGLLLGVKQSLGDELETAFRRTGIIHIVVLSGYNIMLVVMFVMLVLGYLLPKRAQIFFGILAIITFVFLVGFTASVVRASIMASLLLLIRETGRVYEVLRGLFLAALLMVLFNPYILAYDVGFQLSFLATAGLILIAPHLERLLPRMTNFFGARSFLVATLATQIAVLPLLLYHIGEFSVVAVIVNVLVLPMVAVAMFFTFFTGVLSFIMPLLATLVAIPAYWSLQYINVLALWFAKLPFAAFSVPAFSFYLVPVCYLFLGFILWYVYRRSTASWPENLTKAHSNTKVDLVDWEIVEEKDEVSLSETKNK
jgi:competence protein ComEC